jgi:glutamine synthetase
MAQAGHGNGFAKPGKGAEVPRSLPWASRDTGFKVGEYLCETHTLDGAVQASNPRLVARRQLDALAALGFTLVSGYECEFFMQKVGSQQPPFDGTNGLTSVALAEMESFLYSVEHQLHASGIGEFQLAERLPPWQSWFRFY